MTTTESIIVQAFHRGNWVDFQHIPLDSDIGAELDSIAAFEVKFGSVFAGKALRAVKRTTTEELLPRD